ncbi:MAG: hypothetical protein FWH11_11005 [Micrococcales bacterium]|nr:hypothetical protein [Micrococcales bacterium]
MEIRWSDSADKHGVLREDAVNAVLFHVYRVAPYGQSRVPGRPAPELFVGPGLSGRWLEVMAEVTRGVLLVFHVMEARATVIETARKAKEE